MIAYSLGCIPVLQPGRMAHATPARQLAGAWSAPLESPATTILAVPAADEHPVPVNQEPSNSPRMAINSVPLGGRAPHVQRTPMRALGTRREPTGTMNPTPRPGFISPSCACMILAFPLGVGAVVAVGKEDRAGPRVTVRALHLLTSRAVKQIMSGG